MSISADRISRDIDAIAACSESSPAVGFSRPTFSPAWAAARDYVIDQATAAGCSHRVDPAGNVFIRPTALTPQQRLWLSGSHIDSVPTGGKFDGVIGIAAPLELLRGGALPLELVIWAEEEGSTFGLGMIGSRLATGALSPDAVQPFRNAAGQNFVEAGKQFGVRPSALLAERFNPAKYHGLIEIHAEQGPGMWAENIPLATVRAIAGRKQFQVKLTGQSNHAGSTPMNYRRDALVSAAGVIVGVRETAVKVGDGTVATVGKLDLTPNAINVIPGQVQFTIDLRSADAQRLQAGQREIERLVAACGVDSTATITEDQPPMPMDPHIVNLLRSAGATHQTISGALHDAAILAPHLPTAMLFVASKDGISHNPAEFSRIQDIAAAAAVLQKVVSQP